MLRCEVTKQLPGFRLRASLTAQPDEIVAVVGPNGAGKTTLLRIIAGLETPDSGTVEVDGETWWRYPGPTIPAERRRVGYVPQGALLFPHMTVQQNVAFGLPPGQGDLVRAWLERLGLLDIADSHPPALSGGQAQLVAFARAAATEPRVLCLDEPLASVDVANRSAVRRILRRELTQGTPYRLLVTHDPFEAAALADRIIVMEGGSVVQSGPIDELRSRPRSAYVAEMVGVNLFRGIARSGRIDIGGGLDLISASAIDGPTLATVHPRAVALYAQRPSGSPRNVWRAKVAAVEPSLDQLRLTLEGPIGLVAEVTRAGGHDFPEGASVWVSVKASEVSAYPE